MFNQRAATEKLLRTGLLLKRKNPSCENMKDLVGVSGFEPEASWSRTKRDTKLRHTPILNGKITLQAPHNN